MHERILTEIDAIEAEHKVTVIFACESGSRAWGFPSRDSDYDVRMVYHHPVDWYLSLGRKRDVIEKPIIDALDINGWDIGKTLSLLRKSNPNILEWANSPIIYRETEAFAAVRSLLATGFQPRASLLHYLNMADNTRRQFLARDEINVKKYLYTIRPLMCGLWVSRSNSQPPMLYGELVDAVVDEARVREEIHALVTRKQDLNESDLIPRNDCLHDWIERTNASLRELVPERTDAPAWEPFTAVFRQVIGHQPG